MVLDDRSIASQLRRGAVEYCVLALLTSKPRYGFDLVRTLSDADLVSGEGTVYPLLSRLNRDDLVKFSWQESQEGPPRKYYEITAAGRQVLKQFQTEWAQFRSSVDSLLSEGKKK